MVSYRWLLLGCLGALLAPAPAEAGGLMYWRFEQSKQQLTFRTEEGVQPKAQLITNPTRVVIDLPGTKLERPTVNDPVGGAIREVRLGQYDEQTTRIVVELKSGYTIDPEKVQIRGYTPRRWSVTLPEPQKREVSLPSASPSGSSDATANRLPASLQVTQQGLFLNLNGNSPDEVNISRAQGGKRFDVALKGTQLPEDLAGQTFPINRHGVAEIRFLQQDGATAIARLQLTQAADRGAWQASYSEVGGLVLLPPPGGNTGSGASLEAVERSAPGAEPATIQSVQLSGPGDRILIRADGPLGAQSSARDDSGGYTITLPQAQLDASVQGPNLTEDSPIARLQLRQQDSDTVAVRVGPKPGVSIGDIDRPREGTLALKLERTPTRRSIAVPEPERLIQVAEGGSGGNNTQQQRSNSAQSSQANKPKPSEVIEQNVLVMLDPGHGGKDPGGRGIGGLSEIDVVGDIAKHAARKMQQAGISIRLTRDDNYFVSLERRAEMANRQDADLFVSIHANTMAANRPDVNGIEVYHYDSSGTGKWLAKNIHQQILRNIDVTDRGLQTANFYVLRNTAMPAVLVETGFLTGRQDARRLKDPQYRRRMGEAIAQGILQYVQQADF
ncbi:MAG: N-acetylmuramoyl-L-alanine amidase [Cyanobacteria bacterium QS_8_64_29]|nr:MAG: N-acetylmuramoyl-L-alanine amidase [Cyanobacteria bacterium QS_8_64_29]